MDYEPAEPFVRQEDSPSKMRQTVPPAADDEIVAPVHIAKEE